MDGKETINSRQQEGKEDSLGGEEVSAEESLGDICH